MELVAYFVEISLHRGETARVLHDQRIKERFTDSQRQVDTAIWITSGGREFLHIVEVQDRSSRMGSQMVDAVAGKADAIGAHRVTLVASAGFTKGALDRIRNQYPQLIDAVVLRPAKPDEWPRHFPVKSFQFGFVGSENSDVPILQRRYVDALTGRAKFEIMYGESTPEPGHTILQCQLIDSTASEDEHGLKETFLFARGPSFKPGDIVTATLHYETSDGQLHSLTQANRLVFPPQLSRQ